MNGNGVAFARFRPQAHARNRYEPSEYTYRMRVEAAVPRGLRNCTFWTDCTRVYMLDSWTC